MTQYRVLSPLKYRGHKQGETFNADLSPEREQRALDRGAIEIVGGDKEAGLEGDSREELNEKARELGVDEPEKLGNKAAVIEAIRSYDNKE